MANWLTQGWLDGDGSLLLIIIAILVVAVDQVTKALIRNFMPVGDSVPLIPEVLHITHVRNPGGAFGLLPDQKIVFLIISLAIIIFILYYHRRLNITDRLQTLALGLLLGGAVGNIIDRFLLGKVTDFIDFRVWPVFNLADSSIVIGVVLLGFIFINSTRKEPAQTS